MSVARAEAIRRDLAQGRKRLVADRFRRIWAVVEEIAAVSSRLIVNPASMKLKRAALAPLIEAFR